MRVLGVDPGGRWLGYAVLLFAPPPLPEVRYLAAGVFDLEGGEDAALDAVQALCDAHEPDAAAVERVSEVHASRGAFDGRRATDLVRSAWVGGRCADRLRARVPRLYTFPAEAWRAHLLGQVGPREAATRRAAGERMAKTDQLVRALVERRVDGWPKKLPGVLAKDATHARDGGCVAVYGAHLLALGDA